MLKTWSFHGESILPQSFCGKLRRGLWAVLGGLLFPPVYTEPQPTADHSYLREGPGITQPVLWNKYNRHGGRGFPCRSSAGELHPWVLLGLLGHCCCSGSFALCWGTEVLEYPKPTKLTWSPQWAALSTWFFRASFCFIVTLNTGGNCSRISWVTSRRVLSKTAPFVFHSYNPCP